MDVFNAENASYTCKKKKNLQLHIPFRLGEVTRTAVLTIAIRYITARVAQVMTAKVFCYWKIAPHFSIQELTNKWVVHKPNVSTDY